MLASLLVATLAGCAGNDTTATALRAHLVASDDGRVEVRVGERVLFVLAPTGPVARTFTERPTGIGTIVFERWRKRRSAAARRFSAT